MANKNKSPRRIEDYFWIIFRSRWSILAILLGCLAIAVIISVVFPTVYEASSTIALEDVRRDLKSLPTSVAFLGVIPKISGTENKKIALKTYNEAQSGISEAFRIIRTKLQFINPQTIVVTSSTQAEGRTTITSNLAISFAQMDKKVLILDADMRRPSLHKIFPIEDTDAEGDRRKPGLSELLIMMNEKPPKEALGKIVRETGIEKLSFIPSGTIPPNPSELLSSEKMQKLILLLKEEYEYVFIDSPPVRAVADPIILVSIVDYTVYVSNVAKTAKENIRFGLEQVIEANPGNMGFVCNLL